MRVCSEPISSRSAIVVPSRYSEFETADGEREALGGCGTGGGGKPYSRKLWEWVDDGDGIRVVAAVVVRKGAQKGERKKLPAAAAAARTEGRRTGKKATATNGGKGKRKSEAREERGRPSAGGPHRCGARRGQSAAA